MLAALKSNWLPRTLHYLSYKERSARSALSSNGNNVVVKWAHCGSLRAAPKNSTSKKT